MDLSRRGFFGILGSALAALALPENSKALVQTATPPAVEPAFGLEVAFRLEVEDNGAWTTLGRLSGGTVTMRANVPGSAFLEIAAFCPDCIAGLRYCLVQRQIRRFRVIDSSGIGAQIMGYVDSVCITGKTAGEICGTVEIQEAIRPFSARSVARAS